MESVQVFQGPEHLSFFWPGESDAVALLVHGFPGTPAEMRHLGEALWQAGWSVQGLLLPGFGAQIASLGSYRYQDWVAAVTAALGAMKREQHPVLLVGYSLGGALSILAAAQAPADGLALLAPFWQMEGGWQGKLLPVLKYLFPYFRPFDKADFSDPKVREAVSYFAPDIDLDDPEVQAAIRDLGIRTRTISELQKAGRAAYRVAARLSLPTVIVQGMEDDLVKPGHTRKLAQRVRGPVEYREVQAGHDLLKPENAAWAEVRQSVLDFSATLRG